MACCDATVFSICAVRTVGEVFKFGSNRRKAEQKYMKCLDRECICRSSACTCMVHLRGRRYTYCTWTKLKICRDRTKRCCRLHCSVAGATQVQFDRHVFKGTNMFVDDLSCRRDCDSLGAFFMASAVPTCGNLNVWSLAILCRSDLSICCTRLFFRNL